MEKTFAENPTVQGMATSVKRDIADFKEYLPLIGAVCNSGLRERYISENIWSPMHSFFSRNQRERGTLVKIFGLQCIVFFREILDIYESYLFFCLFTMHQGEK